MRTCGERTGGVRRALGPGLLAGLVAAALLAAPGRADSGSWRVVATPNPGRYHFGGNLLDVSATSGANAWATELAYSGVYLSHWNGTRWAAAAPPAPPATPGDVLDFTVSALAARDTWAFMPVGNAPDVSLWALRNTGHGWHTVTLPALPDGFTPVHVRAFSDTDLWAVGHDASTLHQPEAAHWDGHTWTASTYALPVGASGSLVEVARVPGTSQVIATGDVGRYGGNVAAPLFLRWTGSAWEPMSDQSHTADSGVRGVTAVSANRAWAVGSRSGPSTYARPMVERWDGTSWREQSLPGLPSQTTGILVDVAARGAKDVVAVGYTIHDGTRRTLVERYDGTRWTRMRAVNPATGVHIDDVLLSVASVPRTRQFWAVGGRGEQINPEIGLDQHTLAERCAC